MRYFRPSVYYFTRILKVLETMQKMSFKRQTVGEQLLSVPNLR